MSTFEGLMDTFTDLTESASKIMIDKNDAYRGGDIDSHSNFKRIQKNYPQLEVDEIMLVLMDKHLDVIRQGSYGSIDELKERICDCINYLVLIYDYKDNEAEEEDKKPKSIEISQETFDTIAAEGYMKTYQRMKIDGIEYESEMGYNDWKKVEDE